MGKKVVDCRGMNCPEPVLRSRDALAELEEGIVEVIVDNEGSRNNVERFAASQGCQVSTKSEGEDYRLKVRKSAGNKPEAEVSPEEFCRPSQLQGGGLVYLISSSSMGRGDDELGWGLMQTFIRTIKEAGPLPSSIFFYNSGVLLTSRESGSIKILRELEENGVEILSCGTCLDYFNKSDALLVGGLTNMYTILASMVKADKLVSP